MRSTASKVKLEDLVRGKFVRPAEGEISYLLTPWGEQITRARVMGTVVDKFLSEDQNYCALRIDDGSETLRLKGWKEQARQLAEFKIGDLVDAVGRVREYGGEIYLVPDVITKVEDPNWELVRELEILKARKQALAEGRRPKLKPEVRTLELEAPEIHEKPTEEIEEIEELLPEVPAEVKNKVLLALDKLDKGEGVGPAEIAAELNMPQSEVEEALRALIADGDIFEPKIGKFRRLE